MYFIQPPASAGVKSCRSSSRPAREQIRPNRAEHARILASRGQPQPPQTAAEKAVKIAIVAAAALLLALCIASGEFHVQHRLYAKTLWGSIHWTTAIVWGAIMYLILIWRIWLWRRYRPTAGVKRSQLPGVSVIIPAFNEGALVRQSILSVAASRYPTDRLEIIAIDDGSSDDTWSHILSAARHAQHRVRITTVRQPRNMGKRQALYEGFRRARGDVFVTIDSDSVLHPDALRNGVAPLVRDPKIGCVAGCVEVMNVRQSLITRFLKCTFSLSFKFVRAYQSEFRGVFCTPGALSIYRADVVRRVADEWLHQTFLGLPCTTGEDRAMTNLFLREGWLTAYQGNAVVWSKMPHTYTGMVKMLLRWGRSNIRETVVLLRFLFTRFRQEYLRPFRFNMIVTIATLFLPPVLIANSIALLFTDDGYIFRQLGMVIVYAITVSIIYYINERDSDWAWLFLYEFCWVPGFSWIIPYACLTLRNTAWLTRGTAPGRSVPAQPRPEPALQLPSLPTKLRPALQPALAAG